MPRSVERMRVLCDCRHALLDLLHGLNPPARANSCAVQRRSRTSKLQLSLAQSDTARLNAEVAGRVDRERPPAAAHIEEALTRLQQ